MKLPPCLHEQLRLMAANSGWLEVGGRVMRKPSDYGPGGDAVGRTQWIGRPDWARGFSYSPAEVLAIVEKAIAGRYLGKMQRAILDAMLEETEFADLDWRWGSMQDHEKEAELDALFGADTRPAMPAPARLVPADLADFVKRRLAA